MKTVPIYRGGGYENHENRRPLKSGVYFQLHKMQNKDGVHTTRHAKCNSINVPHSYIYRPQILKTRYNAIDEKNQWTAGNKRTMKVQLVFAFMGKDRVVKITDADCHIIILPHSCNHPYILKIRYDATNENNWWIGVKKKSMKI